jgi:hypothetical protein
MAFVRWRIRITQLYLAETEIRRAAVEELFSDVARHPMKAIWIAALCVLSAMRTAGQTTTGHGGSPISVIPNSLPTVAPSKTPQTFRSDGTQFPYPGSYTLYTGTAQVPVPSPTVNLRSRMLSTPETAIQEQISQARGLRSV